jgi:hypothetical protein
MNWAEIRIIIQPIGLPDFERPAIETSSEYRREGPNEEGKMKITRWFFVMLFLLSFATGSFSGTAPICPACGGGTLAQQPLPAPTPTPTPTPSK